MVYDSGFDAQITKAEKTATIQKPGEFLFFDSRTLSRQCLQINLRINSVATQWDDSIPEPIANFKCQQKLLSQNVF